MKFETLACRRERPHGTPEGLDAHRFHFDVQTEIFSTGLKVLLMHRPQLPILSLSTLIPAGVVSETSDEAGLAGFTAGLLKLGHDPAQRHPTRRGGRCPWHVSRRLRRL